MAQSCSVALAPLLAVLPAVSPAVTVIETDFGSTGLGAPEIGPMVAWYWLPEPLMLA
jgi:hypothetical protein